MLNAAVQPALLSAVSCCTAITHSPVYRYQACIIDKARQAVVSAIIVIVTMHKRNTFPRIRGGSTSRAASLWQPCTIKDSD